jgi:hypothetical protein
MSKVGRPRNVETPDEMYVLFNLYKTFIYENPRNKYIINQRTGELMIEPLRVPLTLEGFEVFIYKKFGYYIEQYFKNINKAYDEFLPICTHIRKEIRQDQIEGGMVVQYNPSITQRLNNLAERTETTHIEQPLFPDVSTDDSD